MAKKKKFNKYYWIPIAIVVLLVFIVLVLLLTDKTNTLPNVEVFMTNSSVVGQFFN